MVQFFQLFSKFLHKHFPLSLYVFLSYFLLYLKYRSKENVELKKRSEFPENELWDLTALQDQEDFLRAIEKHVKKSMGDYRAASTL